MKRIVEFFQDTCKTLSMSRLVIFLLAVNYMAQSSYIAYQTKTIADLPYQVAFTIMALYGLNVANINIGQPKQEAPQ